LAVSLQVTRAINPAVGCHYFPPGLQLPSQPLRGLLPVLLLGEQRHDGVNSLPKAVTGQRRGCDLNPGPSAPESSTLTTQLPSHPSYFYDDITVDSMAMTAAALGDNVTREPASLDVAESSTSLPLPVTTVQLMLGTLQSSTSSDRRPSRNATVTSQHGDVKPEPEIDCVDREKADRRTSRDKSLHDVKS